MMTTLLSPTLVVLGTGGTIAGTAAAASDHTGYTAAQLTVNDLLAAVPGLTPALAGAHLQAEQLAQLDSKDMDFSTMARLAKRCAELLAQPEMAGLLITHGTDTLEETAYFLHCVLSQAVPELIGQKPVVMTCAMRPATSSEADGPRNLRDAVIVARDAQACGVLVVHHGRVHHPALVQKMHSYAIDAFSSGQDGAGQSRVLAQIGAQVVWQPLAAQIQQKNASNWPIAERNTAQNAIEMIVHGDIAQIAWPRVEIVLNHAHQTGSMVRALLAASAADDPLRGLVVAGTGNATISADLLSAVELARQQGVAIEIATRCAWDDLPELAEAQRQPFKARVRMVLSLLGG